MGGAEGIGVGCLRPCPTELPNIQYTIHSIQYTVYSAQCAVHSIQYTVSDSTVKSVRHCTSSADQVAAEKFVRGDRNLQVLVNGYIRVRPGISERHLRNLLCEHFAPLGLSMILRDLTDFAQTPVDPPERAPLRAIGPERACRVLECST